MINCQNCNTQVPEGTKFCPGCGNPMPEMPVEETPVYTQNEQGNSVPQGYGPQPPMNQWQPNDNSCQQGGYIPNQPIQDNQNSGYVPNPQPEQYGNIPNGQGQQGYYGQQPYNPNMQGGPVNYGYNMTPEQKDASDNKFMACLSYLGILCLVPLFGAKNSPFAQYHAKQGVNLAILSMGWPIVAAILKAIIKTVSWSLYYSTLSVFGIISGAVSIFAFVVGIIGIINACKGECKELPLIGKIKILK